MESTRVVDITPGTVVELPCCGVKNPAHEGRQRKSKWLLTHFKKGLRAKALLTEKNVQCGYIGYLPRRYAWRGIDVAGYMAIHCLWTHFRRFQ